MSSVFSRSILAIIPWLPALVCLAWSPPAAEAADRPDVLVADFEADDYGNWHVEGEAFGRGPARGTLPNQMPVSGYQGQGLVNSFAGGDATTGRLSSPPITIERRYLNFLIGGGHHPGETCLNLLVDGKTVRTATGPEAGGGNERLDWRTFDVADLAGRQVVLEIVDRHTQGWGHVNVDQILQSDRRAEPEPAARELAVTARYLNLPVRTGAPARHMRYVVGGQTVREFDIELAESAPNGEAGSFWAASDVAAFRGQTLRIEVDALPAASHGLEAIALDDVERAVTPAYRESARPQFHFTSRRGWLNDPNGLVYSAGQWHLFYQHNPYGWNWGNMHWAHAVSPDLVHWSEQPIALYPRRYGDWCFSGSAVVDRDNTSGFKTGANDLLVLAYTSTGRGECIAYSNDQGATWSEYAGNPVVRHAGRDAKLVWHAPTKRWVMAVYDETDGKRLIAFHTSPDLKTWTFASRIDGFFECPDLFELPVDGKAKETRWVLYGADGRYRLGQFDGREFHPDTDKQQVWYGNFYAAQTYSDAPAGRRVQIGWGQGITFPGMPFNQQMTVAVELSLRATADGVRLFAWPVKEIESLRAARHSVSGRSVSPGDNPLADIQGELFDIELEIEIGEAAACGLVVRGIPITYDTTRRELTCGKHTVPLAPADGVIRLRVLADRGSLEIFGQQGQVALSVAAAPAADNRSLEFFTRGGSVRIRTLDVYELRTAW